MTRAHAASRRRVPAARMGTVLVAVGAVLAIVVVVAALVLSAALGGSTGDEDRALAPAPSGSSSAPTSPTSGPSEAVEPPPRPRDRACYRLAYDDAVAPTSDRSSVPCADNHTAMTFFVGALERTGDGRRLAVDSDRVQAQVAEACPQRFTTFVGGTLEARRLSMLRAVWFTPTVEESDAGADWFRCDVVALAGNESLGRLTGRLAGVLTTAAGRDRYALCGTAEPGTESFERVVCSADHSWRAQRTVAFRAGAYPGERQVRTAGEAPCEDAGRAAADDPLNFQWSYVWPTREQWRDGQTYGVCWAPD